MILDSNWLQLQWAVLVTGCKSLKSPVNWECDTRFQFKVTVVRSLKSIYPEAHFSGSIQFQIRSVKHIGLTAARHVRLGIGSVLLYYGVGFLLFIHDLSADETGSSPLSRTSSFSYQIHWHLRAGADDCEPALLIQNACSIARSGAGRKQGASESPAQRFNCLFDDRSRPRKRPPPANVVSSRRPSVPGSGTGPNTVPPVTERSG